jgi:dTDP-4-dehydrorhamnose reductase
MKIPILSTGMSGLVGTRIAQMLADRYEFTDLSLATNVDITDADSVLKNVTNSQAKLILHLAAKTDVDGCEDDKILGEEGGAWMINVEGTRNVVTAAKKTGKKVIYISTDFVFDGTSDFYNEDDEPNPVNWYGCTKHEGEKIVLREGMNSTVLRIAYPYRAQFSGKLDFVRKIIKMLKHHQKVVGLTDHIFTPTFIDDIAKTISIFLEKDLSGIYHVVGSQSLTTYEASKLIAVTFGFAENIEKSTREMYFHDRAFRPFKLALKNDKIRKLGIGMKRFDEGLKEVRKQLAV